MVDKCVITSLDYYALKYTKKYDEKIQTGYILSVAYGDFYNMDSVDFFSVNASFLSKRTVDAIHNAGKQVYAWTVNNDTSIKNLTNKGVDNIITDNPVLAREVIYSRDTSETMLNMIKYVFNDNGRISLAEMG
jgi:glycerophosphoryl diester phosphodiesterase